MPKKLEITEEHLEWYAKQRADNHLDETEIGNAFKAEFPDVGFNCAGTSVCRTLKIRAKDVGYSLPPIKSGVKAPNPVTRWRDNTPEVVFGFRPSLIVLSDMHCPLHNTALIEQALELVRERDIPTVLWNGDTFDNEYKGHKENRSHLSSTQLETVEAAIGVIDAFTDAGVDEHIWLQGNHDDKPMRSTDGEWRFTDFLDSHIRFKIKGAVKWLATNRYYAIMEPKEPKAWPFDGPDNFPWRFTHQKNYGKNPLTVARDLCQIYTSNICTGHQHHLGVTKAASGLQYAVDAGTLQDPSLPSYKVERDSRHPHWAPGFVTITDGVPEIHHG